MNDLARRPVKRVFVGFACLLLLKHLVKDRYYPVFEGAIVAVRYNEIADAVHALFPKCCTSGCERAQVCWGETLDQVLLDATRRGDDGRYMLVLDKIA